MFQHRSTCQAIYLYGYFIKAYRPCQAFFFVTFKIKNTYNPYPNYHAFIYSFDGFGKERYYNRDRQNKHQLHNVTLLTNLPFDLAPV